MRSRVRAAASPHARLRRALDRGNLDLAELAAKECPHIDLEDSLEICVLMRAERDERFERAAVRWLGRLLAERPAIGVDLARQAVSGLSDWAGSSPDVGASELAVVLRAAGLPRVAAVLERSATR
jgi:hypothetical protein